MTTRSKRLTACLLAITLATAPTASQPANLNAEMQAMFNDLGALGNVTSPGAFRGQAMNLYTGGGLMMRAPGRNYPLVNAQLPSLRAGCGGIDLFGGAFSFINKAQFVALLQNIGSNAIGYAFKLALQSISPDIDKLLTELQDQMNKINAMNINSCEAAQSLVNGLVGEYDNSVQSGCANISQYLGSVTDRVDARLSCATNAPSVVKNAANSGDPNVRNATFVKGNVIWLALNQVGGTISQQEKELIMSVIGSVILYPPADDGSGAMPRYIEPSIVGLRDLLLGSGASATEGNVDIEVYVCDEPAECLNPVRTTVSAKPFTRLVSERLRRLSDNIATRTPQTPADIGFINNTTDPQLRTDLIAYVYNCTLYDLQDGTIDPAAFSQSTDIWALMGTPNPARFTTYGNPVQVDTCPNVYTYVASRLPAEVARARAMLAFQLNPSLDPTAAQGVIDSQIEQAYYKTKIATAAQGSADLLRQNIMINLMQDTSSIVGQKINDPASIMIATARANATASINSSFLTMGKVAEQALPLVRNVIEAIIYAVFPFVFLLFLLAQGRGLGLALKSFVLSLVWIQLWPPLYAILNYVATLASAKNLEAAARMGASTQGLALETASSIYHGAISDQAVAGYMVISIPIIATAIIKGGEVAFQAVTGVGPMQSAVSGESSATSKGNVTQDSISIDQQQLAPNRSSAFMSTTSNAHGSAIQGSGPDTGVFRYQATLSRLATTFTFSERQATSLSENARESETLARTERDSMQRSQSVALTNALGIQDSFDRSQHRSGASTTSDGGSTSTQLQKLNSVAREVNRRLGLGEESTVGKSVAASASTGAMIPLTQIGAQIRAEGRHVDQQQLQSTYDYARKAIETSQLSEATALVKEFRSSDAYQWARGSRTTGTAGFDSSYREAVDHQSASENAYGRSKELTRAAQFMSEWSSGAQTDFTNYAARRLSERGLLREDDPIKLQRAVTEIAFGYAKGGDVGSQFVPGDSPLSPSRPLPQLLGWGSSTLRDDFNKNDAPGNIDAVRGQAAENAGAIRDGQSRQHVIPGQSIGNDLATRIHAKEAGAATTIDTRRREVSQEQGALSGDYNAKVQVGKVSPNHTGNNAVWDTVGAQADNRATLGTPPGRPSIGEWHLNKDGVPATGPKAGSENAAVSPAKPERSQKP